MTHHQQQELIEVEVTRLVHQTSQAACCLIDGNEIWIPWSILESTEVQRNGDSGRVYLPEWFCEKKGI